MNDPQLIDHHTTLRQHPLDIFRFSLLSIMLICAPLFWGGNRPLPLMVLEFAAIALLVCTFLRESAWQGISRSLKIAILAILVFPLLYLLPVPVSLFEQLPGRSEFGDVLTLVEQQNGWRSISVYAIASEYSWLALLVPMAVFVTVLTLPHEYRKHLIKIVLVMASFQAALGLIQYGDGAESIFRLGNPDYLDSAVGTYPNRNHLAGLLEMALPLALGLFAASLGRRRRSGSWRKDVVHFSQFRLNAAMVYGCIALVILLGLVFTRSRAGLALAMLAILLCLIVYARRLGGHSSISVVGSFAVVGGGLAALVGLAPVFQRFTLQDPLTDVRWNLFATSMEAVGKYFPLGSGPGTYSHVYPQFQPIDLSTRFINHAHNDYIEWLVEGGLIAALLILFFFVLYLFQWTKVWTKQQWSKYRFVQVGAGISLLLIMLHSVVDFNLRIPANMMYFALLAAIFFSYEPEEKEEVIRPVRNRVKQKTSTIDESLNTPALKPRDTSVKNPFEE